MSSIPTMPGIESRIVVTPRLNIHVLSSGDAAGVPVLFIHGNGSSATFWEETMLGLPAGYQALAPDMRGYGDTDTAPVDATLGLADMVDDILGLLTALNIDSTHVVGHSMGGGIAMKLAIAAPTQVRSLTLVAPMSPYGYSGSKGTDGAMTYADGAPGGAGGVNGDFVRLVKEGYRDTEEQMAPLNVLRQFYVKPPFVPAREDELLSSLLSMKVSDDNYPGDSVASSNWPTLAPGTKGILNAISRKYFDASALTDIDPKPPVLWVRGDSDMIVSNSAMWEMAALGAMGFVPGWPGADECPAQPMLDQTRTVLEAYAAGGGTFSEVVIADAAHSPYIEKPAEFNQHFHAHLAG